MPVEPPDQKFFEAARGYAELGMFHEANEELEKIDPFLRAAPEIVALRIEIYRGLEKWELMAEMAKLIASESSLFEDQSVGPFWHIRDKVA
jgi:hypothetical protein